MRVEIPIQNWKEPKAEKYNMSVVFLLDISGSMAGEKLRIAVDSAKKQIRELLQRTDVNVTVFGGYFSTGCVVLTADKFLEYSPMAGGGTSIYTAFNQGIDAIKDFSGAKLVVLLTDGEENSSLPNQKSQYKDNLRTILSADDWTLTCETTSSKEYIKNMLFIPEGNIVVFEDNAKGIEVVSGVRGMAMDKYVNAVSRGAKSTNTFYDKQ